MPAGNRFGGTINWMAPEKFEVGVATAEGDIWAFGMTALVGSVRNEGMRSDTIT